MLDFAHLSALETVLHTALTIFASIVCTPHQNQTILPSLGQYP